MMSQLNLWNDPITKIGLVSLSEANDLLEKHHYLGAVKRGFALRDEFGLTVFANPTSRRMPYDTWLELTRWCLISDVNNAGSRQWARIARYLRGNKPHITTVVSYSDPSVGHTGALYRACNWRWAPTWHRLRPPPSGHGKWSDQTQSVKDRWIYPLSMDSARENLLSVNDETLRKKMPWASYREPNFRHGAVYGGGGDYKKWREITCSVTGTRDP